jgi:hypothetical protein
VQTLTRAKIASLTHRVDRATNKAEWKCTILEFPTDEEIAAAQANQQPHEHIIVVREMTPEEQADQHKRNALASDTLADPSDNKP